MTPLNKKEHLNFHYHPTSKFEFAKTDTICPILASEVAHLLNLAPLVFVKNENSDTFGFFQLLSYGPPKNNFVNDGGNWLGGYIPAYYRTYPFKLVTTSGTQNPILGFDETSGLISENHAESSIPLFEKDGTPSKQFSLIIQELKKIEVGRKKSLMVMSEINELDIFEEWKIIIKAQNDEKSEKIKDVGIKGLWKISNSKLKIVKKEKLYRLFSIGALDVIYAHWFSLRNLSNLLTDRFNSQIDRDKIEESLHDRALKKQKASSKKELNNLVQNLLLDD